MTEPADLLSAYLDDELDERDRAAVDEYLRTTPQARVELNGLDRIRRALSELPELDPPGSLTPSSPRAPARHAGRSTTLSRRAVPVLVAAAVLLVAGVVFVGLGGFAGDEPVAMGTGELMALHREAEAMMSTGEDTAPGDLVTLADPDRVQHMPDDLGTGMERMGVYGSDDVVQLVYSDGSHVVSVFEQPEDSAAPMAGESMAIGDRSAMHQTVDDAEVLMVGEGDLVVTIVGEGAVESLARMADLVFAA